MDANILISSIIFALSSLSCIAGAISGFCRVRTSRVKPLHFYAITVLSFLAIMYAMAFLARIGLIESFQLLKSGVLTSIGVFMLSGLFTAMFIVGCRRDGSRSER